MLSVYGMSRERLKDLANGTAFVLRNETQQLARFALTVLDSKRKFHEPITKVGEFDHLAWNGFFGWAVVYGVDAPRDSTDVWVIRVIENPGYSGEMVERLSDGRRFKVAIGIVQRYRDQARALKRNLLEEKRLAKISRRDLFDY